MASGRSLHKSYDNEVWVADRLKSDIEGIRDLFSATREVRGFLKFAELHQALQDQGAPGALIAEADLIDGNLFNFLADRAPLEFPLVIVSNKPTASLIERSLEFGAHDFFVKPIHPELLRIKLERLIQKHRIQAESKLLAELDFLSLTVGVKSAKAKLTLTEFHILLILKESYPKGASREELYGRIWKGTKVVSKTLDVHLFKLRRKIEPLGLGIQFGEDRHFSIRQA